jgi:hypothetical protein
MADDYEQEGDSYLSLSKLKCQYSDYRSSSNAEREEEKKSERYYYGDQWTADEIQKLKDRGQPVCTDNRIQPNVDGVVGVVEKLRQDPKAYARTPKHEQGAEIATYVLNYCLDVNRWKDFTPNVARHASLRAAAGIELSLEPGDNGDLDVKMEEVRNGFFYDKRSVMEDFSDALYMGVAKMVDLDRAKGMFPDHADYLGDIGVSGGGDNSELDDREHVWFNSNEKQIRLIEHWYLKNEEWYYCFYTGNKKLEEGISPFKDENGKTFCRFIMFSANIDHDGDRHGLIRNLMPMQDEVNHRRSKGLHAINTIRVYIEGGQAADPKAIQEQINRNDGLIILPPGAKVDERSNAEQARGNLEMLAEAKASLEVLGLSPQMLGDAGSDQSGRAIALLQQAALSQLGPFIVNWRAWKMDVYRKVWSLVRQNWTAERFIRVTDDEGAPSFMAVNQLMPGPNGPVMQNQLGSLDVDIIIDEGPDTVTLMQDVYQALSNIPGVPPQAIIETANLPNSVKKKLMGMFEQAAQQPNPEVQAGQAKLELAKQEAMLAAELKQQEFQQETAREAQRVQLAREKQGIEMQMLAAKAAFDRQQLAEQAAFDRQLAREKAADEIEIKRMTAEASAYTAHEAAITRAKQPAPKSTGQH